MGFKEYLNEAKAEFILTNDDGKFLTIKGTKISFSSNLKDAKRWNAFVDVVDWEDINSDKFSDFTEVKMVKGSTVIDVDQTYGKPI